MVVGAQDRIEKMERMAKPIRRQGPNILAGYGVVGRKVVEMLRDAGETCTTIDLLAASDVDIVGNVLERATLERASINDASTVILALADDSEAVFATAIVREYAPEVPLIVRVNPTPNTARIYRAGADFAISQGQVAGQILAYHLLDKQVIPVESRIKFTRLAPGTLIGSPPWNNEALEHTGAKIIAVERGNEIIIKFNADFRLRYESR